MKQFRIPLLLLLTACILPATDIAVGQAPAESKIAIPQTLDEAVEALDRMLSDQVKAAIKNGERKAIDLHFSLGMGLRNQWGLWGDSVLAKHFNVLGIMEPDAMSAIIIETHSRKLRNEPLEVEKQIAIHKAFWDSQKKMRDLQAKYEKEK